MTCSDNVTVCALPVFVRSAGLVKLSEKPNHYKRRPKANGRPQASIFAIGLDCLIDGFRRFIINRDYGIFNQLLRFLSGKHLPNLV